MWQQWAHRLQGYLCLRDWRNFCVALRLPPQVQGRHCSLKSLYHKITLKPDEVNSERSNLSFKSENFDRACEWNELPTWAFLIDDKHLHIPVPAREPNNSLIDGVDTAKMLRKCFIQKNPSGTASLVEFDDFNDIEHTRRLESINLHLRLPVAGVADVVDAVNELIRTNASSLHTISLSADMTVPALRFLVAACAPSPASHDFRMSPSAPPPTTGKSASRLPNKFIFDQNFENLKVLDLSVPVEWSASTRCPSISTVFLRYLSQEIYMAWGCPDPRREEVDVQLENMKNLLDSISPHVKEMHITGQLNLRQQFPLFAAERYYPRLAALNLGWTCMEELVALRESLKSTKATVANVLTDAHLTYTKLFETVLREYRDIETPHFRSATNNVIDLPPKVAALRRLTFSGPVRVGLSDLHLDLYTAVNKNSMKGVHFQYGLFSATAEGVMNFRAHFKTHGLFFLFRDVKSRLHHLYVKSMRTIERSGEPFSASPAAPWQRRNSLAGNQITEWTSLLTYPFVSPATANRREHRLSQRRPIGERFHPPSEWDSSLADITPPNIGPTMSARDLFIAEMWQLPTVCFRNFNDSLTAAAIWDQILSDEQKQLWEECLAAYIAERSEPSRLSFDAIKPWWMKKERPATPASSSLTP